MTQPFPEDVEVAIVAHNNLEFLPGTLASLAAAACPPAAITVVDIASTDGTGAWLAAEWPTVRVHRLARNEGPNPGRNVGITSASRPFVLLMDGDVTIDPDAAWHLHAALVRDSRVGIGSPIVVNVADPQMIQYAGGAIHFICEAINPWVNRRLAERGAAPADIGAASGCALLLNRAAAIEAGLFDERYFLGKDDGDFIHRVRIAGYLIRELPDAIVRHRSRPRSTWLFMYQIRNRWHFMLKNYQTRTLMCMLPCLLVHETLQLVLLIVKGHGGAYVKAVSGLAAMLPALGADRRFIRSIRRRPDALLLEAGPLLVRDDLAGGALATRLKAAYEGFLNGYWRLLRATVLRA